MGRGKAREKRLADYFDRTCLNCALERTANKARCLTDVHGKRLPAEVEAKNVARWQEWVRRLY